MSANALPIPFGFVALVMSLLGFVFTLLVVSFELLNLPKLVREFFFG
jgi:hypothetical protein